MHARRTVLKGLCASLAACAAPAFAAQPAAIDVYLDPN
jgi:hypothetical protein